MVIFLKYSLVEALRTISFKGKYLFFVVSDQMVKRNYLSSCFLLEKYGEIREKIIDLLNQKYSHQLPNKKYPSLNFFDLNNWLANNLIDEVSFFLVEAGSNALNHSQYKVPYKFHLWLGEKGFVLAVEQKGEGFSVKDVLEKNFYTNEGRAFSFYQQCKNKIFFDNLENARIVYLEFLF